MDKITDWTDIFPDPAFLRQTRIHPSKFSRNSRIPVWIKREDETAYGIPGSKLRKYASLLPLLRHRNIKTAVLAGGAYSNHLAAFPQLLIEHGITPLLVIRGEPTLKTNGNSLLIRLINPPENIHWVERSNWMNAETIALDKMATLHPGQLPACYIPEGAFMPEALRGAKTLGQDIRRNESESGFFFQHIFMDSGTGLSAISALLDDFPKHPERKWHILLAAGTPTEFHHRLDTAISWNEQLSGNSIRPDNFILYERKSGERFGKINSGILDTVIHIARTEGILTDPVYGAPLWNLMQSLLGEETLTGPALWIHSGGSSLWGSTETLSLKIK